jgi:predicted ATP-dependent endonuclease of OLD family
MLNQLTLTNFTLFKSADLKFSPQLNVIVGENGMGKSHLLKLMYSTIANSFELQKDIKDKPTKAAIENSLATKLLRVMRPDSLGRLVSRKQGKEKCEIDVKFSEALLNTSFAFSTGSKTNVDVTHVPSEWQDFAPVYLPTRELLTIYPGFVSLYENRHLEFEETWRDTCLLLGEPLVRGQKEKTVTSLLKPLEKALGGKVELDVSGRFYLKMIGNGRVEMPLVAEGMRKLAMIARLIATGALLDKGYLFWDEPEANLNPKLIREVAKVIVDLSKSGIQVFIATHSYFLLKEIELLTKKTNVDVQLIGLYESEDGMQTEQVKHISDLAHFTALDEELAQYDRELAS